MAVIAKNNVVMKHSGGTYALVSTAASYFADHIYQAISVKNFSTSWCEYSVKLYEVMKQSRGTYAMVVIVALYFAEKMYQTVP
jgi:hypothetical protein